MSAVESMGLIDPESPVRLRALITALASHLGVQVLRVEVELGRSTRTDDGYALSMVVTHSLGPEHELRIGPPLAEAFSATLNALARNASKSDESSSETGSKADGT